MAPGGPDLLAAHREGPWPCRPRDDVAMSSWCRSSLSGLQSSGVGFQHALDARHGGSQTRRKPVRAESIIPDSHHRGSRSQRQSSTDPVDDQQITFHASIDERLSAVAQYLEDGGHLAIASKPKVGESTIVKDQ